MSTEGPLPPCSTPRGDLIRAVTPPSYSMSAPHPLSPASSADSCSDSGSGSGSGSWSPQLSASESSSASNSPRATQSPSLSPSPAPFLAPPASPSQSATDTASASPSTSRLHLTLPPLHPAQSRPHRGTGRSAPLTPTQAQAQAKSAQAVLRPPTPTRSGHHSGASSPGAPSTPTPRSALSTPRSALRISPSTSMDDLNGSCTPPSPQSPLPSSRRVRIPCDLDVQEDPLSAWEKQQASARVSIKPEMAIGQHFRAMGRPCTWTDKHIQPSALEKLRSQGDDAADEIIKTLRVPIDSDMLTELERVASTRPPEYTPSQHDRCVDFLSHYDTYNTGIDFARVASGQRIMLKYFRGYAEALLYTSLIGGVFARDINQVLKATGYLTPRYMKSGAMTPRTPSTTTPSHNNKHGPITSQAAVAAVRKLSLIHDQQQLLQQQSQHCDSPVSGSGSSTPTHDTPTETPPAVSSASIPSGCPFSGSLPGSKSMMSGSCPIVGAGARAAPASERELKNTARRIIETNQYVISIITSDLTKGALQSQGHRDSIRVRLLHARVRVMLARQGITREAINQEEMLITLIAFSVHALMCLNHASGRSILSTRELDDVCYLWGYCGRLMGIRDEHLTPLFTSYEASEALSGSVAQHLIPRGVEDVDPDAPAMAKHMLQAMAGFFESVFVLSWGGYHYQVERCTQLQIFPDAARALGLPTSTSSIHVWDRTIPWDTRRQHLTARVLHAIDVYVAPYIYGAYDLPLIGDMMIAWTRWFLIRASHGMWTLRYASHTSRAEAAQSLIKGEKGTFHFGMSHAPTMDTEEQPSFAPSRRSSLIRAAGAVSSAVGLSSSSSSSLSSLSLIRMFLVMLTVCALLMVGWGSDHGVIAAVGVIVCGSPMLLFQQRSNSDHETNPHHHT